MNEEVRRVGQGAAQFCAGWLCTSVLGRSSELGVTVGVG